MASRPAQKARRRAASPNGGPPRQPKAGSVAQREMIEDIAQSIMSTDRSIWRADMELKRRGQTESDLASVNGQRIVDDDDEQVTWKQHKDKLRELNANLEAAYPALMPAARKLVRKTRKEMDAQE